ncbi:bis(5'-adenosyl)-triphosphatase [Cyclospora cayetanensis]|uniref:Bis(5'-adenosyl)-triphosphatase n=1 Tax=Cyclospora cayetanensis TaxID=88456 RepID=A0A6P6RPT7_9EIME|nr:bis(5'-adenosyl)-triphosphatase [Cyclospora cayetanensis]
MFVVFGLIWWQELLVCGTLFSVFLCLQKLSELTSEEIADLFTAVQSVGELVRRMHNRQGLTVSVQDGAEAGQTVPHVHVHVLPRSSSDFKRNDEVYEAIDATDMNRESHSGPDCEERPPRTSEEMAQEADALRVFGQKLILENAATLDAP